MTGCKPETVYPLNAVRAVALATQQLTSPSDPSSTSTIKDIEQLVAKIGCVQIDTLQVVHRSHYLVLWSRLGPYQPIDFDRLIYSPQSRHLFEAWQHAASIIPISQYRFQIPGQRRQREQPHEWYMNWLAKDDNRTILDTVMERIRTSGAVRARDFEYNGPKRGSWWDWKPVKVALEYLFACGKLMIADRINFQRVYDLTERVLPSWVNKTEPSVEERDLFWIEQAVKALGVCQPAQAAEYAYMKRGRARAYVDQLIKQGVFRPIKARLIDDQVYEMIVHHQNLDMLEMAADGEIRPERTTFLSPFDNLFWARDRDVQFWGFRNVLEAYKPSGSRIWGYFCLAILHNDRLVGRFDPKLERHNGTMRLKSLYLEPGIELDDILLGSIAAAMHSFLKFHKAEQVEIEQSQPVEFGDKLIAYL